MTVSGNTATVQVSGEVDAGELVDASLAALRDGATNVVVDFQQVTFIDSAGLGALIEIHREASIKWGAVTIRNPPPMLVRLLQITLLDEVLEVEQT